jgi:uncharacterized membrane protein YdjX (TVP38/TMEM64 family)
LAVKNPQHLTKHFSGFTIPAIRALGIVFFRFMRMNSNALKTAPTHQSKTRSRALLIGSALFLITLIACYFIFPGFQSGVNEAFEVITSEDKDQIRDWVQRFGMLGPLVLILAMGVQMFMLIIPNILLFVIAILCYGPVWGGLISLIGVFVSSSLGYFIGKKLGPRAIDRFVSQEKQEKIQVFIDRYGMKAVVVFRLSSMSTDSLGFVAGILEMNYKKYILATLAGVTPVIILIAIYGTNGKLETALIWLASISLVILVIYIILDRKHRQAAYAQKSSKSASA